MPKSKGESSCLSPRTTFSFSSFSLSPSPSRFSFSPITRPSFSDSIMDSTLDSAELIITRWDPQTTTFAKVTSLFYKSRTEARDFIKTVHSLQETMHFLETESSSSEKMARAKNLMHIAMKRLEKEFYQILSVNRARLDPESVSVRLSRTSTGSVMSDYDDDDDDAKTATSIVSEEDDASTLSMDDLKLIADCMISSGYANECLKIYKVIRKSIVDEGIYRLGVEKFSSSHVRKMEWTNLEVRIVNWIHALRSAVKTLFNGEQILCDHVFGSSCSIAESCFAEITREGALILFGFPETVAKHRKKLPDKVFRILDMYIGICDYWPDIDSIFSFESTSNIKSQALTSLVKLGEFVRTALHDFESVISKDSSKTLVAGGGIHDLTTGVMQYLMLLSDYSNVLSDILEESQPQPKKSLPQALFGFSNPEDSSPTSIAVKTARLIVVLLCKLDAKSQHYKDVSLAYLFLANNLQFVVAKVRTCNLKYILGDEWLIEHDAKVKQFAANYERTGWSQAIDSLPPNPTALEDPEKVNEIFGKFNTWFDLACKKQSVCVVPDSELREDIKVSVAGKIFRLYRDFYKLHKRSIGKERYSGSVVRYTPEDVGNQLSDLFFGNVDSRSSSSSESSLYSSPSPSIPSITSRSSTYKITKVPKRWMSFIVCGVN